MIRKSTIALLAVLGVGSIVVGVQAWLDRQAAARVVSGYVEALRRGDRDALLAALPPGRRAVVEERLASRSLPAFAPETGFEYAIHGLELDGDRGVAVVRIERDAFRIEPRFHLVRNEATRWKVDRIDGLDVDPQWLDLIEDVERRQGEELAEELARRLAGRPGVSVERVVIGE